MFFLLLCQIIFANSPSIFTAFHWHLQQPIYWATNSSLCTPSEPWHYQTAWCSSQVAGKQGGHPESGLQSIFGKPDRVAVYQYRMADSIDKMAPRDAGAQSSFAGDLIENVDSIASQSQWGYGGGWQARYAAEQKKTTSGGFPKLDLVQFTAHHQLLTLAPFELVAMDLAVQEVLRAGAFGGPRSRGLFPAEMEFTERAIPTLARAGVEWVMVADNHISRACRGYPFSPSGDNCDPPNRADQVNPPQDYYWSMQISRGCRPNNAVPYAITPHYAQHVDPDTGNVSKIVVVPAEMALSWVNSAECMGAAAVSPLTGHGSYQGRPPLVLMAHDGDNAFGGGYTAYEQCYPDFVNGLAGVGAAATTVQQYLAQFPVPETDVVGVEAGGWVNKDGDFGSPNVQGWNWPPTLPNGTVDIKRGYQVQPRQYAVVLAALNYVLTAQQVSGAAADPAQVAEPTAASHPVEKAFHFLLPAQTSGYEYYGNSQDMPDKPTVAANMAVRFAKEALSSAGAAFTDRTPPSLFPLDRFPYNPGGQGAGALWDYQLTNVSRDFYVYTMAFDVSGVAKATLYVREDGDGVNPIGDHENELFRPRRRGAAAAGGPGPWQARPMTRAAVPAGQMPEWNVHFDVLPEFPIADRFFFKLTGFKQVLLDYFVEVLDEHGNMKKSDIYHVWVD